MTNKTLIVTEPTNQALINTPNTILQSILSVSVFTRSIRLAIHITSFPKPFQAH